MQTMAGLIISAADLQVLLLENVRFHKQEEKNDPEFAQQVHLLPPALFAFSKGFIALHIDWCCC